MSCGCWMGILTGPMKYEYFVLRFFKFLECNEVLILYHVLGPKFKFLIIHCFYNHYFDAPSLWFHEILNITLLTPLLLLTTSWCEFKISWNCKHFVALLSSLDGPTCDLYDIFRVEFTNITVSLLRPPRTPNSRPATPQGHPKAPQGPPRHPRGPSKDTQS